MNLENPIFSCENHGMSAKVAAVVVPFNRKPLLVDFLTALFGQIGDFVISMDFHDQD